MLDGAMPVRDYVERGIPLMSAFSALAQLVLGEGLRAEVQLIAAAFAAAAALVCLVASRVSGSVLVGVIAALFTVVVHPVSYSYPKLLLYAATFATAFWYATWPSSVRLAALALSVVAAFLFRHDHGVFLGLGSLLVLLATHDRRQLAPVSAAFVVYGILFASPWLAWVQAYQGIPAYVGDGVAFSRREAERSRQFELPSFGIDRTQPLVETVTGGPVVNVRWSTDAPDHLIAERERAHGLKRLEAVGDRTWQYELSRWSSSALESLVRDPVVADTHGIDRSRFRLTDADPGLMRRLLLGKPVPAEGMRLRPNALAALFYLAWAIPVIAGGLLLTSWNRVSSPVRGVVLMVAAVQLLMNVTMLRDPIDLRVRDVVVPMAILMAFVAGFHAGNADRRMLRWMVRAPGVAILAAGLGAAAVIGPFREHLDETGVFDGAGGIRRRAAELADEFGGPAERTGVLAEPYRRLVDYVAGCSPPEARLFTMTFAPELFFYTDRGFAGGHVSLTPGYYVSERHATMMLDRLAREDVPFVIVDTEVQQEMADQFPAVAAFVDAGYLRVAQVPIGGDKRFDILAQSRREVVSEFGADRLPCFVATPAQAHRERTTGWTTAQAPSR
jgi:hypothetical protein